MESITLASLRTQVRQTADMVNSTFVSDSELNQFIDLSYAELYDILTATCEDYYTLPPVTFTIPDGYTIGFVDVAINGSQLSSVDYTATNSTTVVLTEAAIVGDSIRITSYDPVSLADTYRKAEVDQIANDTAIVMAIALG